MASLSGFIFCISLEILIKDKKELKMYFHVMEILFRILAATVSAVGKSNLSPGTSLNWAKVILIEIKDKDKVVCCLQYIY